MRPPVLVRGLCSGDRQVPTVQTRRARGQTHLPVIAERLNKSTPPPCLFYSRYCIAAHGAGRAAYQSCVGYRSTAQTCTKVAGNWRCFPTGHRLNIKSHAVHMRVSVRTLIHFIIRSSKTNFPKVLQLHSLRPQIAPFDCRFFG